MYPIKNGLKQGDALSPLLLKFVLEIAIRMIQANHEGLKLNNTHQLMVYAGPEVNAENTKYVVMSQHQSAVKNHSTKISNKSP